MLSKSILLFFVFAFFSIALCAHADSPKTFAALCYHDISNGFVGNNFSLRKKDLVTQFDYLKAHYNVVSLQDLRDASAGVKELPEKAVLLTFDDGLMSFYENVFPLLKEYKFKAVFAIVVKWTEDGAAPDYGFKDSNPKMATWAQLKEMSESGLVEIVSHSYDLHQGHLINPQGNQASMAGYFGYDPVSKSYQSEKELLNIVRADLKKSNEIIKKNLGLTNTVMVWPYGSSNGISAQAAREAGMTIQMTLQPGLNNVQDLSHIGRGLMMANIDITKFATVLEHAFVEQSPVRMIRVDLDGIWKKSESESEQILGDLLEKVLELRPSAALIQASSKSGDVYFPTKHHKERGDYLNRVAHTLKNRAQVPFVYARLPENYLKNSEANKMALRDLAKFTDVDGVYFEISAKTPVKDALVESAKSAIHSIRPFWRIGLMGQSPQHVGLVDDVVLTSQQLEKDKARWVGSVQPARLIVSVPLDYKIQASHALAQGFRHLYHDNNFKDFTTDSDYKSIFSVPQHDLIENKGEAK